MDDQHSPIYVPPIAVPGRPQPDDDGRRGSAPEPIGPGHVGPGRGDVEAVPVRPAHDPDAGAAEIVRDRAGRSPVQARATASPLDVAPARGSRLRPAIWVLLILLAVIAALWLITRAVRNQSANRYQAGAPMPVGIAKVQKGDMPVTLSELGTVTPLATVTVKTQINGQLTQIAFQEGQIVNKGDFLAQIDPRPYQVALEQAQGQLAKDQAALTNARLDLTRYRTLVAQNSIARQTLDTQVYTVQQDEGTVQADQAQIDTQKLNLAYCHIVAPVTGRVGLRQVDLGNYVQTSDANGIVVITQLQPISVVFTLPEDNLPAVLQRMHAGATLPVTAYDRTGTVKLGEGTLETLDNQIDTSTGTVRARAIFPNADETLFPNQFVNVQLLVNTLVGTDVVPASAIERGAPGTFVYVVKPDNTVAVQAVKLGPSDGQRQAVLSGLQPGQSVVTDGADRLKDGAKVTLAANGAAPAANPTDGSSGTAAVSGDGNAASQNGAAQNPSAPTASGTPSANSDGQPTGQRHGRRGQRQQEAGQPQQQQPQQGSEAQGSQAQGSQPQGSQPQASQPQASQPQQESR